MRKLYSILFLSLLLFGCSPQKRLSLLLEHHPELRTGERVQTIGVAVPIEYAACDTFVAAQIDSVTQSDTVTISLYKTTANALKKGITVKEGLARASVCLTDTGIHITAEQLDTTLMGSTDIKIPQYEVAVKAELTNTQQFFHTTGIMIWVLIGTIALGTIVIVVLYRFKLW